jgi:hypothetical protein
MNAITEQEIIARHHRADVAADVRASRAAARARHQRTAGLLRRLAERLEA